MVGRAAHRARELLDRGDVLAAYAVARDHAANRPRSGSRPSFTRAGSRSGSSITQRLRPGTSRKLPRLSPSRSQWPAPPIGKAALLKTFGSRRRRAQVLRESRGYSITYYGQLARAKLGLPEVQLRTIEAGGRSVSETAPGDAGGQTVVRGRVLGTSLRALRRSRGEPDRCRSARGRGPSRHRNG